jgi:cellulase (glycosyl hydrolase family 5)
LAVCKQLRRWLVLLGVIVAAVFAANASASGIATGFEIPDNNNPTHFDWLFGKAAETKVQYIRLVAYWDTLVTSKPANAKNPSDPAYNWTSLDARVNHAVSRGLTPFVTVWRAPSWAEQCSSVRPGICNPNPAMFGDLGTALATRYGATGKVRNWEVWNEPNLQYFLMPQQAADGSWRSPIIYRNLLNSFATAVRAVDSGATIIAGATAPLKRKPSQPGPLPFMRGVLCLKPACSTDAKLDAWSTHPYTNGGPRHHAYAATDVSLGDLPEMRRVLQAGISGGHVDHARSPVGLWVGEFGWDTKLPDPKAVGSKLHSRWVSEALYRSWQAGVTVFIWHQVMDRPLPSTMYQGGLFFCGRISLSDDSNGACEKFAANYSNNVRKLSWRAFYFPFVAYDANGRLTIWGRTPGAQPGLQVAIQRRTSSGWRTITSATSNGVGIFSKVFRSSLTKSTIRARVTSTGAYSLGFSLVRPYDPIVAPFGCGGGVPC